MNYSTKLYAETLKKLESEGRNLLDGVPHAKGPQEVFNALMPKSAQEPQTFEELVYESIGRASVRWSELPKGVFDSVQAKEVAEKIIEWHEREMRDALKLWINGGR